MKVYELIEILSKIPANHDVLVKSNEGYYEVQGVHVMAYTSIICALKTPHSVKKNIENK